MIRSKHLLLLSIAFLIVFSGQMAQAQEIQGYSEKEVESYKARVRDQVSFLSYLLNTLGSESSSVRDKDVIIRESYKKIFKDAKVQIEDDLTADRRVMVNKDVTAYLKDIEFFFENVQFNFEIKDIEPFLRENDQLSFKVEANRTLKGTDLEGNEVLNTQKRFIEINLDSESEELQIASIYTTKVSREEALIEWWNNLSFGWRSIFREKLQLGADSVGLDKLFQIAEMDSINIEGNDYIVSVEPLSMLVNLKYINLSNTKIDNIAPLSSLTEIKHLNISNTPVADLSYLRYAEKMKVLDLSFTPVEHLEDLNNLQKLESLYLRGTSIADFTILSEFSELRDLDLSESRLYDVRVLAPLNNLKTLNLGRTNISGLTEPLSPKTLEVLDVTFTAISDISSLSNYEKLRTVNISNTQVISLQAFENIATLEKIYADNTFISKEKAGAFTDANPDVLVIINSEELSAWWASLSPEWKAALRRYMPKGVNEIPEKEHLSKLLLADSLDLNNAGLLEIFPLKKFSKLRYLSLSENRIRSLSPLTSLSSMQELDVSATAIESIEPILSLRKITKLNLSNNTLTSSQVLKLSRLKSLLLLNIDQTNTEKVTVRDFLEQIGTTCVVIFDSQALADWWHGLDINWKQIMQLQMRMSNIPDSRELHELIAIKNVVIVDEPITDLKPLEQFIHLESLYLERVGLSDLKSLAAMEYLNSLTIKETPISSLDPIAQLKNLEELNLNYSSVDDLRPLQVLRSLKRLSVAGTKIRHLKGVEELTELEYLDISSTLVRRLKRLEGLNKLKELRCYNTRIWKRRVDSFKEEHQEVAVRYY